MYLSSNWLSHQRGILAMGPARRLADISKREFFGELGKRKTERHYTVEELEEDVAFARSPSLTAYQTSPKSIHRCNYYLIVILKYLPRS